MLYKSISKIAQIAEMVDHNNFTDLRVKYNFATIDLGACHFPLSFGITMLLQLNNQFASY